MLKTCAKTGTAKKLSSLDCEIASKTGTVGKPSSKDNLDAWNISYTKAQTVGVWLGNLDNTPIKYAGGNQPTEIVKKYFEGIKDNSKFIRPDSIIEKNIDGIELEENHRVILANTFIPERFTQKEMFSMFNLPNDISKNFTEVEKVVLTNKVENGYAIIEFNAKPYQTYNIIVDDKIYKSISGKSDKQSVTIPLINAKQKIIVENYFTIIPENKESQEINFIKKEKKKQKDKWYI